MSTPSSNLNGATNAGEGCGLPPTAIASAASDGSSDRITVCWIQIPLRWNNGDEVDPDILEAIKDVVSRWFGGLTVLGQCMGMWEGQREPSLRLEVAIPMKRLKELKHLVHAIGLRLEQKVMYVVKSSATALFIDIDGDE